MKKENQTIKCDVHSCVHCNCDENVCKLREIEVQKQCGCDSPCTCRETVCGSFKKEEK